MWLGLWGCSGGFSVPFPDGGISRQVRGLFAGLSESARRSACDYGETMAIVNGWYCEHHDVIAIGEKANGWEMYCRANRRCTVAEDGCHAARVDDQDPDAKIER